jgi:hypothetical protein
MFFVLSLLSKPMAVTLPVVLIILDFYPLLVALSLRRFGEGTKVCCEIAMMAADAGLIPQGEEAITVAGTGKGADTVTIIKTTASKRFLDLRVLEILATPRFQGITRGLILTSAP